MYRTLAKAVKKDTDLPDRVWVNTVLTRFLDGSIYDEDILQYEFYQERTDAGEYIPISKRAPSVRYALLNVVVNDSVSFLFSENHFPDIDCEKDEAAEETLKAIIKDTKLNETMLDAATRGSVGSIVVWVRVLGSRLFFEALPTTYLTPKFQPVAPDTLESVTEKYKVKGRVLLGLGYQIAQDELGADFWFQRIWDAKAETWFMPWLVGEQGSQGQPFVPQVDSKRSVTHNLGFVPMVWVLNLPGGDKVDGACTFKAAIDDSIEINYQLSQAGRGLKYSSSPTLMMKDDAPDQQKTHVVGDAIVVPIGGDAKLLEISGDAASAVIDYAREVRKLALESVGGSRADSDKLSAATSGRAMELMNQSLIWLADRLRISYGEGALLKVLKMVALLSRKMKLVDSDAVLIPPIAEGAKITLKWPKWYAPTADDRQADALAITTLTGAGVISIETAVTSIANDYDIEDVHAEMAKIEKDSAADLVKQKALQPPLPQQIARPAPAK